eukprot:12391606-Alexandrium_andersonii.AAC.1
MIRARPSALQSDTSRPSAEAEQWNGDADGLLAGQCAHPASRAQVHAQWASARRPAALAAEQRFFLDAACSAAG